MSWLGIRMWFPYFPISISRRAGGADVGCWPGPVLLSSLCLGWWVVTPLCPVSTLHWLALTLSGARPRPAQPSQQPEIEIILCCEHTWTPSPCLLVSCPPGSLSPVPLAPYLLVTSVSVLLLVFKSHGPPGSMSQFVPLVSASSCHRVSWSPYLLKTVCCCRMRNLLLLATLTLAVSLASAQQNGGLFSGLTSAFNNFFGGSGSSMYKRLKNLSKP